MRPILLQLMTWPQGLHPCRHALRHDRSAALETGSNSLKCHGDDVFQRLVIPHRTSCTVGMRERSMSKTSAPLSLPKRVWAEPSLSHSTSAFTPRQSIVPAAPWRL